MSHFAVYALTRNVGIDIVPPAPLCPDCSPGIPGANIPPLYPPSEFLISRNSYKPAVLSRRRCFASRAGMPSAYILATVYSLSCSGRAHVERKIARPHPVLSFISD